MLEKAQNIFFVGIGGIGISALARILKAEGKHASGSDIEAAEIINDLETAGIEVKIGHKELNLPENTQVLVYSTAVPEDNAERQKARSLGIPEMAYPKAVGEWAKDKKVIAVAGTNGKTTTAAMIAHIMIEAGLDPSAIIGSKVSSWNSNARLGKSGWLVLEADEYRRAFLNYRPEIAVITNIAADHLDYYKDLDDIKKAFEEFVNNIKPGGTLIYNSLDLNAEATARRYRSPDVIARPFSTAEAISLQLPGKFNRQNAAAAAAVGEILGITQDKIKSALENFTGTWRRFEKIGRVGETDVISDYAHHPAGIKAVSEAATEVYKNPEKILLVFQPHQHNRTRKLFTEFVKSFCSSKIKNLVISEIFDVKGREAEVDQNISSRNLVDKLVECDKKAQYAENLNDCEKKVKQVMHKFDAVILVGAGDIYKVADKLVVK